MKKSKILLTTMLTFVTLGTMSTLSNAALQSNFTAARKKDSATNWVINVRNMEARNGGMGLSEAIDPTKGLPTTASNGIDVHLQKNTEYGAAILLGASDYGKQGAVGGTSASRWMDNGQKSVTGDNTKASTTGNVTGVYDLGNTSSDWEWTAGGMKTYIYQNIASRYVDNYDDGNEKAGDATWTTKNWHGSNMASGLDYSTPGVIRGLGAVFAFRGIPFANSYFARACVVSAPGI